VLFLRCLQEQNGISRSNVLHQHACRCMDSTTRQHTAHAEP
jgi:hypothetical protein